MAPNPDPLDIVTNGTLKRRHYHHNHEIRKKQQSQLATIDHDLDGLHRQLSRSISLVLEAVGFEGADPGALESFSLSVDEFMSHFLKTARASMVASRRPRAIPHDFELALTSHRYTLRSLLPHLDPPVTRNSCPSIFAEDSLSDQNKQLMERFHTTLNDHSQPKLAYAPRVLPILPSHHTYKATLSFLPRERDAKKIRELATEEARMGEEALRRLIAGSSPQKERELDGTSRQRQTKQWRETMEAMAHEVSGEVDLMDDTGFRMDLTGAPVNADKLNWRKPVRRKEAEAI